MSKNIAYQTDRIAAYYAVNRRRWADFYPSEQLVFERVATERGTLGRVLDVGCAAGGLAEALAERFGSVRAYTGIDINRQAIETARADTSRLVVPSEFIVGDICDCSELVGRTFDLVAALSVADWNIDAHGILAMCWDHVAPGGHLVMSLRLTTATGISDITRSFQYIWFESGPVPAAAERAPYNVFNTNEALAWLASQVPRPEKILIHGYWGTPSRTARTLYERLIFSVVALRKPRDQAIAETVIETDLPHDAFTNP
ncbi:MAG: class I SAM-dependent methyltransferase [Stellaceae bacterium]